MPFAECFSPDACNCPLVSACRLNNTLSEALDAFYATLDKVTLASLVEGNEGLKDLIGTDLETA